MLVSGRVIPEVLQGIFGGHMFPGETIHAILLGGQWWGPEEISIPLGSRNANRNGSALGLSLHYSYPKQPTWDV